MPKSKAETHTDPEVRTEQAALEQLTLERDSLKDQLLRAYADLQNQRKRFQSDRDAIQRYATESLIHDLLPVLDNFERTIAAAESGASLDALLEGLRSVDKQLRAALEARGLGRIDSQGAAFDPAVHMAVAAEPSHDVQEGTVTQELEAGYKLAESVIRPAKVKVAKRP